MGDRHVAIVAEIGSVHDGSFGNAVRLVETAAACGADAVKFQLHLPEAESTRDAPSPPYFSAEPRFEYFARTGFSKDQWARIASSCAEAGVEFVCSAFSIEAVAILEDVGVSRHKVASGEVTNLPLLEAMASTGKPVLLSSGMSSWAELDAAVDVLRSGGPVTVLQCTSQYPCPPERVGLNVIAEMAARYALPVGFSDHTSGNEAAIAAVALGASVVEKHLTFSKRMYGSDAPNAAEPEQMTELCRSIRAVERMLENQVDKDDISPYAEMKRIFEKSIVVLESLEAGTVLTAEMLGCKKPGTGIAPSQLSAIVGRRLARPVAADAVLQEGDLA